MSPLLGLSDNLTLVSLSLKTVLTILLNPGIFSPAKFNPACTNLFPLALSMFLPILLKDHCLEVLCLLHLPYIALP